MKTKTSFLHARFIGLSVIASTWLSACPVAADQSLSESQGIFLSPFAWSMLFQLTVITLLILLGSIQFGLAWIGGLLGNKEESPVDEPQSPAVAWDSKYFGKTERKTA